MCSLCHLVIENLFSALSCLFESLHLRVYLLIRNVQFSTDIKKKKEIRMTQGHKKSKFSESCGLCNFLTHAAADTNLHYFIGRIYILLTFTFLEIELRSDIS